jgi:hypothetical protein
MTTTGTLATRWVSIFLLQFYLVLGVDLYPLFAFAIIHPSIHSVRVHNHRYIPFCSIDCEYIVNFAPKELRSNHGHPTEMSRYVLPRQLPLPRLMPSALNDPQNQWIFCPSIPGAIAGLALFSIITLAHFVQAFMYRKRFCWVICMATSWETASFVFRVLGARDPRNELYNTGSQILVILAPLWVNAFAYMVMGRLVYYWLLSKSVWNIKARKMTKFFVWFDVFTFLVQLGGGGMLSSDDASSVSLGMKICKMSPNLSLILQMGLSKTTRYGWNWRPTGLLTSVRHPHHSISPRHPQSRARSTHFLETPTLYPIRSAYLNLCEYPIQDMLLFSRKE